MTEEQKEKPSVEERLISALEYIGEQLGDIAYQLENLNSALTEMTHETSAGGGGSVLRVLDIGR